MFLLSFVFSSTHLFLLPSQVQFSPLFRLLPPLSLPFRAVVILLFLFLNHNGPVKFVERSILTRGRGGTPDTTSFYQTRWYASHRPLSYPWPIPQSILTFSSKLIQLCLIILFAYLTPLFFPTWFSSFWTGWFIIIATSSYYLIIVLIALQDVVLNTWPSVFSWIATKSQTDKKLDGLSMQMVK